MIFPKLESDRSTATIETYYYIDPSCYSPQESVDLHTVCLFGIGISANFFNMLFGLYAMKLTTITTDHVFKKIESLLASFQNNTYFDFIYFHHSSGNQHFISYL